MKINKPAEAICWYRKCVGVREVVMQDKYMMGVFYITNHCEPFQALDS